MLELAIFDRETLARDFGCSRRLASRVGAWLGQKIALTVTVLESAAPGSALEKLLLERALLSPGDLAGALAELQKAGEYAAVAEEFALTVAAQNGWAVIATAEDAMASVGFAGLAAGENRPAPATAAANPPARPVQSIQPAPVSQATPAPAPDPDALAVTAVRAAAAGAGGAGAELAPREQAAFSPAEAARLRIAVFTAPTSAEKVSALGQYAFAAVPPGEKAGTFLQALANEDAKLRAAAARGMRAFGVAPDVAETLAAIAAHAETALNAERLEDLLAAPPPSKEYGESGEGSESDAGASRARAAARDATLMLLAGCVRDPGFAGEELAIALRALARLIRPESAPLVASPDFLRLVQERMLSGGTLKGFREVFAAVEAAAPGRVSAHFLGEIAQTRSDAYRALLFALVDGWRVDEDKRKELLPAAIATFAALPVDHPQSHALRKFVFDGGDAGLRALAESLPGFDTAHQRAAVRFADNALHSREGEVAAGTKEAVARACLGLLALAPLALRVDVLETQTCLRPDLPGELRAEAARAILRDWTDYAAWPLNATFENALVRLGAPAVTPILAQLRAQRQHPDSAVFAAALGRIGVALPAGAEADRLAADILREVVTMTFRETAIRDALHLAMGRIAARPGLPAGVNALVRRALTERLGDSPEAAPVIRALGMACGGNLEDPAATRFVMAFAFQHLDREAVAPGLTASTSPDGEEVFEIGAEVGEYSDVIPACIEALRDLARGPQVPAEVRLETTTRLLKFLEEPQKLSVRWGLANVTLLTASLGAIGVAPATRDRERLAIAVALAKRTGSAAALEALAAIVALPNRLPQFDRLATALVERLTQKIHREKNDDERENCLRILTRALHRGRFAVRQGTVEEMLAPVAGLYLSCLKQGLPNTWRMLDSLRQAGVFTGETAALVSRELDLFTSLQAQ